MDLTFSRDCGGNRWSLLRASFFILQIMTCRGKNWMYSKSWIEDYRAAVKYGLPSQTVPTEYSMETHKIVVIQRADERYLDDGGYDYRESVTLLRTLKTAAVRNKGVEYVGRLVSDRITVPKNVTHSLPSVRVDMILSERTNDAAVNRIGLLESPESDDYSSLSSSLRSTKKNSSISHEFVLCGNYGRKDMLSIGYVEIHYNDESRRDEYATDEAAVIDPYFFMVVVRSLTANDIPLATCDELNVRGAIFHNTVPGVYLPFAVYRRFIKVLNAHADKNDLPHELQIWKRRDRACFETPVDWNNIPAMRLELFSNAREAVEVTYPGQSLIKRHYTKNSERQTYCYVFAIRRADGERVIFGRAAFEGLRLIFNRSGRAISFMSNACCGAGIKLRKSRVTGEDMSSCLPKNLRGTTITRDTYWIWIMVTAILLAVTAGLLSIPKSLSRTPLGRPTIHVFIPQAQKEREFRERSTETTD